MGRHRSDQTAHPRLAITGQARPLSVRAGLRVALTIAPLIRSRTYHRREGDRHASLRLSFTERRRRRLAFRSQLERMESRSTVTPVGLAAFAFGAAPVAAQLGAMHANGEGNALTGSPALAVAIARDHARGPGTDTESIAIVPRAGGAGGGGSLPGVVPAGDSPAPHRAGDEDATAFIRSLGGGDAQANAPSGISAPWQPAKSAGSGGGALPPRGGSGGPSSSCRLGRGGTVRQRPPQCRRRQRHLVRVGRGVGGPAVDPRAQQHRRGVRRRADGRHDDQPQRSRPGSTADRARRAPIPAAGASGRPPRRHLPWPYSITTTARSSSPAPTSSPRPAAASTSAPRSRLGLRHLHLLLDHLRPDRRHQHQRRQHLRPDLPLEYHRSPRPRPSPSR